jgi:hypothetical protein
MKWLLAVLLICLPTLASARNDGRFPVNDKMHDWFMMLKSNKGPCCADADGSVVMDADWEVTNGHYRVRLDGKWIDVPDDAVVKTPNLYGPTMVWPIRWNGYGGTTVLAIRCFMPGVMM